MDTNSQGSGPNLDVERDSDVPISTQIYWQLTYKIESGRLQPGERLWPVRELGAALRVNPNTIRAVYRRLADNGYVVSRHGAGTVVAGRTAHRRRPEELGGIVSEMLRRAAQAGFTPDEVAAAAYAAASERKRPSAHVHVLFAECTTADAGYDAERLNREFEGLIQAEGTLLDELPERLERFHYDLVATTTFHADEAQAFVGGKVPVVAMLVGPGYMELVHEIAALPAGSRIGVVCATERGTDNIAETLAIAGTTGVEVVSATIDDEERLKIVDRTADVILLSREAIAQKLDQRISRPERVRQWAYEFDPAGLEHLRRAIDAVLRRHAATAPATAEGEREGKSAESAEVAAPARA
ncbi:MAG TPA: GntR family transcriptional regulator [Candidatus Binatia bacterium]|nr:GntR family transcriptional regulator [Candidatus Binatia bacterium]